jgi:hypothetical protein
MPVVGAAGHLHLDQLTPVTPVTLPAAVMLILQECRDAYWKHHKEACNALSGTSV